MLGSHTTSDSDNNKLLDRISLNSKKYDLKWKCTKHDLINDTEFFWKAIQEFETKLHFYLC